MCIQRILTKYSSTHSKRTAVKSFIITSRYEQLYRQRSTLRSDRVQRWRKQGFRQSTRVSNSEVVANTETHMRSENILTSEEYSPTRCRYVLTMS